MSRTFWVAVIATALIGVPLLGFTSKYVSRSRVANSPMMGVAPMMRQDDSRQMMKDVAGTAGMMGEAMPADAVGMMSTTIAPRGEGGFTAGVERSIVKTASLSLVASNTRELVDRISEKAVGRGGTVTASNVYEATPGSGDIRAEMTVRVPVAQLSDALTEIRQLASRVVNESVSADDRTEQKIDLQAQLTNLKATEAQLQTIMKQASNVSETLQVQQQLSQVRSQIERLQAQIDNLTGDAAMATIRLSISTRESDLPISADRELSFKEEMLQTVKETFRFYRDLFIAGLKLLIVASPVLVLGGVVWAWWGRKK